MQRPQQNYAESPEFLPIKNKLKDVVHYSHCLWLLYIKPEMTHLARYHWKVAEVKTYINKSTEVKHECLIATLNDGDKGEVVLWIGHNFSTAVEVAAVEPSLHNFDMQQLVHHTVFDDGNRISLPQLIVMACAIDNYSREYRLFEKGCYWFCYAIRELLLRHSTLSWRGWLESLASSFRQEVNSYMLSVKYDTMWSGFENDVRTITEDSDITYVNGFWQIELIVNRQHRPIHHQIGEQQHWQQQYASKITLASVLEHVPLDQREGCLQTMRDAATRPSSPTPPLSFHETFQMLIATLTEVCTS